MTQAAHNARCYGVKLKYSRERCQSRYRRRYRAREAGIASKIEVHHAGHDRQKGRNTASNAVELEVQYPTSTKLQRSFKSTETQRLLQFRSNHRPFPNHTAFLSYRIAVHLGHTVPYLRQGS